MKFTRRAANIAAVLSCAVALAAGTTPGFALEAKQSPFSSINTLGLENVPTMAEAIADLTRTTQPEEPATIVSAVTQIPPADIPTALDEADEDAFATLSAAVDAQDIPADMDPELACLAIGVYYEAKGEPLEGQLAVADVILNRTTSGRFPSSVCSVLKQPGQFSFVRGGRLPQPALSARAWRTAVAVATVARDDTWESNVPRALFFHARQVSPGWRLAKVGAVGNHIFYR
jgi:spore germination cell wall hydrolase CwlJ-like protein